MMNFITNGEEVLGWREANIKLENYYNLFPEIKVYIDHANTIEQGTEESGKKDYTKIYSSVFDVSECATNIRIKSALYNNCGQFSCKLIHEDCQQFRVGDRVRLYLDGRCWFCGFIFTTEFESKTTMMITAFDYLRYFKAPLIYGKNQLINSTGQGLSASEIFTKICQDLKIPFEVIEASTLPVTPQNHTQKTAFNILSDAITETVINSPAANRLYYMYYHESHFSEDENTKTRQVNMKDQQVFKNSGKVIWRLRNNLITDSCIDDEFIYQYNFKESIDEQTYNEVIVYKDQKTYLSKTGKTLKNGKKTGTQIKKVAKDNKLKALYGYLPYFHRAPDGWSEAQMQQTAQTLQNILARPTHSISLQCYGIIGLRAGYMVPVVLDLGGTNIGYKEYDEKTKQYVYYPAYRTVVECEHIIEWPLKMNVKISSGMYSELE